MNATNTFQNGLVTDSHPLAVSNDTLTNCLNGTLITYNGNELILQNDVGNSKIIYKDKNDIESEVKLTQGFIPIGMKSFGGIIYIFSHNPITLEGEIGTFPSPDYTNYTEESEYNIHKLQYTYKPLHNLIKSTSNKTLQDLRTKAFNFDLEHPVQIDFQISYDESINIIFNDGKNIPRLINNGFAPYGNNQVKIIKRDQNILETNVYEEENFEYNTSLVRVCNSIVDIKFDGENENGSLPVGNYVFYFKVADSDDNESEFIGQSGLVVCHKGRLNDPKSIDGGVASENSGKTVKFTLSKIPRQFTRVYVYYSRYSSTQSGTLTTEYKKILKYFDLSQVKSNGYRDVSINITGYDNTKDIGVTEINQTIINPLLANSQAISENILFLGNVKDNVSLYTKLKYFSRNYVTVEPAESELQDELLLDVSETYENKHQGRPDRGYGYYNIHNIYDKVGYWPEEYYRFGIVYILNDYSVTPAFNIRGLLASGFNSYNDYGIIKFKKQYFKTYWEENNNRVHVLQFPKFKINREKLPNEVIGCIFVRQKRIKNIIGQALQIGTDFEYTHIPVLWAGKDRKWITQSFVQNSKEIHDAPLPFMDNSDIVTDTTVSPSSSSYHGSDHSNGTKKEVKDYQYFRHDYQPNGAYFDGKYFEYASFFDGPEDIKLGSSWITNLPKCTDRSKGPILGVFEKNPIPKLSSVVQPSKIYKDAAIMPEFEINQQKYSSIFTGGKFLIDKVATFEKIYFPESKVLNDSVQVSPTIIIPINPIQIAHTPEEANIISVIEQTTVKTGDRVYKTIAGNASDPTQYVTPFTERIIIGEEVPNTEGPDDKDWYDAYGFDHDGREGLGHTDYTFHTRGIFSPYLGIAQDTFEDFNNYTLINIRTKDVSYEDQIKIREQDQSEFYPISKRVDLREDNKEEYKCFGGDCYIGNFTHRMLRNFIDPEFPIQDEYAQIYCWSFGNRIANYDTADPKNGVSGQWGPNSWDSGYEGDENHIWVFAKDTYTMSTKAKPFINRSDVNSVPLGQWITFKYYSSINPCMRSTDGSNISERAIFGQNRKFYPLYDVSLEKNNNKLADSYIYNEGYEQSLGKQIYPLYPEVSADKEEFSNRILYSDINVETQFSNNLRTFRNQSYRDYTRQYGKIIKLVPYNQSHLLIIFEHGIGAAAINEKAVVSQLASKTVYLETNRVIGDLEIISPKYGSQWIDSIVDTPTGIYGVDASAKKIWRVYAGQIECISDLKVNKFIRDNLVTNEISNQVNILTFNVTTHYNAHKQDIMFTFHRNLEDGELIAWNLCYNEVTKKMTTFYSWLPLISENINETYYSIQFDPKMAYLAMKNNTYNFENYLQKQSIYLWEHNKENNWCNWYGEQHPFEFEYVVNAYPNFQKIFNNLQLIGNKAKPESFHFEIVGESYDFSKDKKNMYHRQEATKSFYDWCMSRILGDNKDDAIHYDKKAVQTYLSETLEQNEKSTIFPLTVKKLSFNNVIYNIYKQLTSKSQDYQNLSGSEIVYDNTTNDYLINTHIKAHPKGEYTWQTVCRIDDENVNKIANYYVSHGIEIRVDENCEYLQKKVLYNQRLSNCKYVEDSWKIQIPSINYYEKNEDWSKSDNKPPINLVTDPLPEKLSKQSELPINASYPIETENWINKKQTKIRDKYIKIKIRYTGDDLVIVSGIINIFKETYN